MDQSASMSERFASYEAERRAKEDQDRSKVSFSPRSKEIVEFQVPLSIVTSFQDLLNRLDIDHYLRRAENCRIEFPEASLLRKLYRFDELFEFLQAKRLVILQENDTSIRIDLRNRWSEKLNHEWHLIVDLRALDAIRFLFTERAGLVLDCIKHLKKAEISLERCRIRADSVPEIGDACRLLNARMIEEGIPLEAIGVSGDILFEYHVWTDRDKQ